MINISVIIPTHNPRHKVLGEALSALRKQTLPFDHWELIIVDNASAHPVQVDMSWHPHAKIILEPSLGLTSARICGIRNSSAEILVFVDDDNLLDDDYLQESLNLASRHPEIGAFGGKSIPRFEQSPPSWWESHLESLLACRDLGGSPQISHGLYREEFRRNDYPLYAPHGAGMVIRKTALDHWFNNDTREGELTDRRGDQLSSGGDNDIVLSIMRNGWEAAYFPSLSLIHVIPKARIQSDYLQRLNRGIAKSWIQVLHKHHACPWSPISAWTVPLRKLKAWISLRAWSGPIEKIRWQGACGHFEGLSGLNKTKP